MNILVIGGSYFCGKCFVQKASENHQVSVLNRGSRRLDPALGVKEYIADRTKPEELRALDLPTFDAVVDFCAYRQGDIAAILEVLGDRVKHYVFVSTCDVYRRNTGEWMDESSPLEDRHFGGDIGDYIQGKAALETELKEETAKRGIAYTSVRPAVIYGPGNYAPREEMFFTWIRKAGQVLLPQEKDGRFQMVYVEDVAALLLAVCEQKNAQNKVYNFAGEKQYSYEEFADCLEEATGLRFERVYLPAAEMEQRQIPMPFALTAAENQYYLSRAANDLGVELTPLSTGLKKTYDAFLQVYRKNFYDTVDRMFDDNRASDAKAYMLDELERAKRCRDEAFCLEILNELIGYYRQTSEVEKLEQVCSEARETALGMGLEGTVPYATTLLNIANAYRSIGRLEQSLSAYRETEAIYRDTLPETDMRYAGLLNNMSLLMQEMGNPEEALRMQKRALEISTANQAGFEIAVSLANLANTLVQTERFSEAKEYARRAIACFEERRCYDAHYCAALSALGMCEYHDGSLQRARELFEKGMEIVESTLGQNLQYQKLKANRDLCLTEGQEAAATQAASTEKEKEEHSMTGMELSRAYYETYGEKMIREQFPEYENKIAVGLVGPGSDCFGFDDELSRDHDWGPDFCLWVTDETYALIGEKLQQAYEALPVEFMGYTRVVTDRGKGRRGVRRISEFYESLLGTADASKIDFAGVEDYALAAAVNGQVFRDDEGSFSAIRSALLQGYPERIRFLKLAEDAAKVSQCGQYNYQRVLRRGDELTAQMMLSDCMRAALKLVHHLNNCFPPHDKWLKKSAQGLPGGAEVVELLEAINRVRTDAALTEQYTRALGELLAGQMYAANVISDIDWYLDHHTEELLMKASLAELSNEELVTKIAKLEFTAFDQVKNEGGRAYCQNDWPTFSVMRKSQYLLWNRDMLMQYYYDFNREFSMGHNLITEKYGRMMESTAPERFKELEIYFPELTEEQKRIIEQIVAIQMNMMESFAAEHPNVAHNARRLHTYEDNPEDTSYETYLRGEISTYSDKMLQLYGQFVVGCIQNGVNIAQATIENTAKLYGYADIEELEKREL